MKISLIVSIFLLLQPVAIASAGPNANERLLKTLVESSRLMVPQDKVACEITGVTKSVNGKTVYSPVSIGDYLSSYIDWTSNNEKPQRNALSCKGDGILDCTLQYGLEQRADHPGFGTFLRFQFDKKRNAVIPESLHCITVP